MKTVEEKAKECIDNLIDSLSLEVNHEESNYDAGQVHALSDYGKEIYKVGFLEGQSNPNIKQLEWVEVNGLGEIGIEAKTPFGNYEVYEKSDHDGYILWWFDPKPYVFDTEIEAKMYAQADFERRVMECLD